MHAARQMIKQGPVPEGSTGYKIIGCASIGAFKPFPLLSHYSASKWAVRGLTQGFAMEMSKHKINVNAYAPGIVGTAMWDLIDEKLGEIEGRPRGETIKKYSTEMTAMGRVSTPEDVGKVVGGFMCSEDADFVTGQTLVVDGGEFVVSFKTCTGRDSDFFLLTKSPLRSCDLDCPSFELYQDRF